MKKSFLFAILVFLLIHTQAQRFQFVVDSVKQKLQEETTAGGKAYQSVMLAAIYSSRDSAETVKYAHLAFDFADAAGDERLKIGALNYIGSVMVNLGHYDAGISYFDSLAVYAKSVGQIENEADCYNNISYTFLLKGNLEQALKYELQALELKLQIGDKNGIALAHGNLGQIYESLGENDKALVHLKESLKVRQEFGNTRLIADSKLSIGKFLTNNRNLDEALTYLIQAEATYNELKHELGLIELYSTIGLAYDYKGNYPRALDYYIKSVQQSEQQNISQGQAETLINIGALYSRQRDFPEALKNFQQALEKAESVGDQRQIAQINSHIGYVHKEQGEYDLALVFFQKSMDLDLANDNKKELATTYGWVAEIMLALNQIDQAMINVTKALEINEFTGNQRSLAQNQIIYGKILIQNRDFTAAKLSISKGIALAQEIGFPTVIRDGAEQLAFIENGLGNFQKAYEAQVLFKQMEDSLNNVDAAKKLTLLQAEYDFEREKKEIAFNNERELMAKNGEIDLLMAKEELSNIRLISGGVATVLIIFVGYFIARSSIRAKTQQAQHLREMGQFKASMTGMIAHDLKNPLSVILNSEDVSNNQLVARQMLLLVNNMLDVNQLESNKMVLHFEDVHLNEILVRINDQLNPLLQQANQKLVIEISSSYQIKADALILERVLINLISNAMKFSPVNKEIIVKGFVEGDKMRLAVIDHGKGIAEEDQQYIFESFAQVEAKALGGIGSTGLGLTFCKLAIEAHGSQIGITSQSGKGTTFFFDLELTEVKANESELATTRTFTISENDQQIIKDHIVQLKAYNLYQIGEIEEQLKVLNGVSPQVDDWVEEVLNAAYAGNEEKYEELLEL